MADRLSRLLPLNPLRDACVQPAPKSRLAVSGIFVSEEQERERKSRAFNYRISHSDVVSSRELIIGADSVGAGLLAKAFDLPIKNLLQAWRPMG